MCFTHKTFWQIVDWLTTHCSASLFTFTCFTVLQWLFSFPSLIISTLSDLLGFILNKLTSIKTHFLKVNLLYNWLINLYFSFQAACGPKTNPSPNSGNSTFAFHPVKPNIPYRLWSPVYGGSYLLQRGPNNVVNCKGELGGYRNFNESKYQLHLLVFGFFTPASGNRATICKPANEVLWQFRDYLEVGWKGW